MSDYATESGRRWQRAGVFVALTLLFVMVLVRTAWVSDDAYITFRSVDQVLNGHGPRWNLDERVQAFSHPLWFIVLTAVTAIVREPYYAAIGIGIVCTLGAVALLIGGRDVPLAVVALGVLMLLASKAFVDYSTSGLENSLTALLLAAFVLEWRLSPATDAIATRLVLVASALWVNRPDSALLVAPAVLWRLSRLPWRAALRAVSIGSLPFMGWELFSLLYYGFPLPNTYYAKLSTGIPLRTLIPHGLAYYRDSWNADRVTLPVIVAGAVLGVALRRHRDWALSIGILIYLAYVVRIGGDFMSGRFFVAPFVLAMGLVLDHLQLAPRAFLIGVAAGVLALALSGPPIDVLTGPDYRNVRYDADGIADERGYYYQLTGLLRRSHPWQPPVTNSPRVVPADIRPGRSVAVQDTIGLYGYQAPLTLHIVDVLGLAEPFLSRLPSRQPFRIGHFYRTLPEGYLDTLESGTNQLRDVRLAEYFDAMSLITRGPLFSGARLKAIVAMNLGLYDALLPTRSP